MDALNAEDALISDGGSSPSKDMLFKLFQPENLPHSWAWTIFLTVIYSIIFIVGIAGNFVVIFVYRLSVFHHF